MSNDKLEPYITSAVNRKNAASLGYKQAQIISLDSASVSVFIISAILVCSIFIFVFYLFHGYRPAFHKNKKFGIQNRDISLNVTGYSKK